MDNCCFLTWLIIVTCCGLIEVGPQHTGQCGVGARKTRRKRVIGGTTAQINSWPWLVNMIDKNDSRQYCSAIIIDRLWILTVAHCFFYKDANKNMIAFPLKNYSYIVADHKFNFTDPHECTLEPSKLFVHPKYKPGDDNQPGDNDITLIKLKKPLKFTKQIGRACLPTVNTKFHPMASCYLAGWGNTVNTNEYHRSSILKEVKLKLVSLKECNSKIVYNGIIPKTFRCAGYAQGGKDGCYGDSGASLQCYMKADRRWTVAGLMSWGAGCGNPNRYGVYTNVQEFLTSFIRPVLRGPVTRLITYQKRRLHRKRILKMKQKSLYYLFTKRESFTEMDLVRNLQLLPSQIKLLKCLTLVDYVAVMNTTLKSLSSMWTPIHKIVTGFQQNSEKFENYKKCNVSQMLKKPSGSTKLPAKTGKLLAGKN